MAAEAAKLCCRQQDVITGEHVWVDATYFDDPQALPENQFSASLSAGENKKVYRIIGSVGIRSCRVCFNDGTKSSVAKFKIYLVSEIPKQLVNFGNVEEDKEDEVDDGDQKVQKMITARMSGWRFVPFNLT